MSNGVEQLFDSLRDEFDGQKRQDADARKTAPQDTLVLVGDSPAGLRSNRVPEVRPAQATRQGRKEAAAEQARQWRMIQTARRHELAQTAVVAVAVHAHQQLDLAQEIMADRFYGGKRHEAMNQYMGQVTSKCLAMAEAGVMALMENLAKGLAEDL
jgi:hypothetical protein